MSRFYLLFTLLLALMFVLAAPAVPPLDVGSVALADDDDDDDEDSREDDDEEDEDDGDEDEDEDDDPPEPDDDDDGDDDPPEPDDDDEGDDDDVPEPDDDDEGDDDSPEPDEEEVEFFLANVSDGVARFTIDGKLLGIVQPGGALRVEGVAAGNVDVMVEVILPGQSAPVSSTESVMLAGFDEPTVMFRTNAQGATTVDVFEDD